VGVEGFERGWSHSDIRMTPPRSPPPSAATDHYLRAPSHSDNHRRKGCQMGAVWVPLLNPKRLQGCLQEYPDRRLVSDLKLATPAPTPAPSAMYRCLSVCM
jgi:hypothetical protein